MPDLVGLSHVWLTVTDVAAARRFWSKVMGLEVVAEQPGSFRCVHPASTLSISVNDHDGNAWGVFDERRPGLDHLSLAVADRETLNSWERWLAEQGVEHSPVEESSNGFHLNLRAPDQIAVELFVPKEQAATRPGGAGSAHSGRSVAGPRGVTRSARGRDVAESFRSRGRHHRPDDR